METLSASTTILTSSSSSFSSLSIFSWGVPDSQRFVRLHTNCTKSNGDPDLQSDSNNTNIVPLFNRQTLSQDAAMGLVLSAASVRGWTTGSGMEGPPVPEGGVDVSNTERVSTMPWSLFTKSPRRRMRVAFTCNICGQRTTRAINPHAYTDGTVFVQCCGCNVFHKLVDNLNLFHDMKCYVNQSFNHRDANSNAGFKEELDDDEDVFPV